MPLTGKVALVTGASRGIGKAIATTLGASNATVIGTATSESGAEKITAMLQEAGIKGRGVQLNVSQKSSIDDALSIIADEFAMPAILVNNAGVTSDNLFLRMKPEEWDKVIDTNLTGIYRMISACIRPMVKARWGRIVNVSSVVATMGNPGQANYCAAKAGILGLTKSLAKELGSRGITVNALAPGFIETDMTNAITDDSREALISQIPVGRIGAAEDIAHAINFLVSPASSYITGETLHVNGGMWMA